MKPIVEWQDGDEISLPTGEMLRVRSESYDGDRWWCVDLPNKEVVSISRDESDNSVFVTISDQRESPLSVYWSGDHAELGYVPLCVCGNDGCNDSTYAFGANNSDVSFHPDVALRVLAVLARMPRATVWRREEDVPGPQEPVWLGVIDEAGHAVIQRYIYPRGGFQAVSTRALEDLVSIDGGDVDAAFLSGPPAGA